MATPNNKSLPDTAAAALLAVLTAALLLILRPLADVPMNDDFSWARSAEAFARTGRIVYNGWGNPILLPHIVIGGILIKIFGYSHVVLGAFGIVSGALFAGATYLLARACLVPRALATCIVGLAVLNPVFLACAPSFMSDIPSTFLYTCALLAFVKSAELAGDGTRYRLRLAPLLLATVFALLAGANRQILWAALLIGFAVSFVYLTPADRVRRLAPALGAILSGAVLLSLWFSMQPYSVRVSLDALAVYARNGPDLLLFYPYKYLSFVGLAALPVTIPLAVTTWRSQTKPARGFAACLACGIVPFVAFLVTPNASKEYWNGIWRLSTYGQYATYQGVMVGGPSGFENRPLMMPEFVGTILNLAGAIGIGLVLWGLIVTRKRRSLAANVVLAGCGAQLILPLPWYASGAVFDRYLISLVPCLLIALTARRESESDTRQESKAYLLGAPVAALFAFGGIVFAAEYFGYTQARARLYHTLLSRKIEPQHIDAGVEHSGDTQIVLGGFINNPSVKNPPGAYRPDAVGTCLFSAGYFPVMDARFLLCSQYPAPDLSAVSSQKPLVLEPEPILRQEYRSPITPNVRTIYVYRIENRTE